MNSFILIDYYSLCIAITFSQKWDHTLLLCNLLLSHNTMKSLF